MRFWPPATDVLYGIPGSRRARIKSQRKSPVAARGYPTGPLRSATFLCIPIRQPRYPHVPVDRRLCVPRSPWVCPRTRDKLTYGSRPESISARFYRRIRSYVKVLPRGSVVSNQQVQKRELPHLHHGKWQNSSLGDYRRIPLGAGIPTQPPSRAVNRLAFRAT